MTGKWTPGPWFNQKAFRSIYSFGGDTSGLTIFVAKAEGHQCGEEQADANARLIAAAPTMAEALRRIAYLRPGGPCRNKLVEQMEKIALAALSQALGEGT